MGETLMTIPLSPRARLALDLRRASTHARESELEAALTRCAARSCRQLEGSIALEPCVGFSRDERVAATINGVEKQKWSRPKQRKAA
jgi:hypothetical protein